MKWTKMKINETVNMDYSEYSGEMVHSAARQRLVDG